MSATSNWVIFNHDTKPIIGYDMDVKTQALQRTRKYPVTLTPAQNAVLIEQADAARSLWNLIHVHHDFYATSRRYPTLRQTDAAIRQARAEVDWLGVLPAQAAQQVLRTYTQAWKNYWSPTHPAKRPTFKSRKARRAVDVPQARDLDLVRDNAKWGHASIPKVGRVKVRMHQPPPGTITGARLVNEATGWFLVVRGAIDVPVAEPRPTAWVGIDVGVTHTLALSVPIESGPTFLDMPKTLSVAEGRRLHRLDAKSARQRAHRVKGTPISRRLARTYDQIARTKARQARRRDEFAHQASARLATAFTHIAVEDLRILNMTASARGTIETPGTGVAQKTGLNRCILNQGWSHLNTLLAYKAQQAGGLVVRVPPHGTSLRCHRCGSTAPGQRDSQASFKCANPTCGWTGNADHNAAHNIKQRGQELASQDAEPIATRQATKRQPRKKVAA